MSPLGLCAYLESNAEVNMPPIRTDKGKREEDKQRCHCSFSTPFISTEYLGYTNIRMIVKYIFRVWCGVFLGIVKSS